MAEPETTQGSAGYAVAETSKLEQEVEITDKGPCLKHIKVTIPRTIIEQMVEAKLGDLQQTATVPGFRPGRAPAKLVRRYLEPQALEEIRPTLLMASLEDLMKKHNLNPISMPEFDPLRIEIPKEGPLVYELEMEVWPEFELPPYKGLKLKRPVFAVTEELVDKFMEYRFRNLGGRVEEKEVVEEGDTIVGTLTITRNGEKVAEFPDVRLECQHELRFRDGLVSNFLESVAGARVGDSRDFTIVLSETRGTEVPTLSTANASVNIQGIYKIHPAGSLLEVAQALGLESLEQLRELSRQMVNTRIESLQRMFLRQQILSGWINQVRFDLPPRLLQQLHLRNLRRRVEELLQLGYSRDEINRHSQILISQALSVAVGDIVSQMVSQKIADQENLEVTEEEVQQSIERLAEELNETPRRLRTRLEREGRLEDIVMALLDHKVVNFIIQQADIEDVPVSDVAPEDLFQPDRLEPLLERLRQQILGESSASQPRIIVPPSATSTAEAASPGPESANPASPEAPTTQ